MSPIIWERIPCKLGIHHYYMMNDAMIELTNQFWRCSVCGKRIRTCTDMEIQTQIFELFLEEDK